MNKVFKENAAEALTGLFVVVVAIFFVLFAWSRTGGGSARNALHITASFPSATGVTVGSDVRVAGLKVGTVSAQRLDPQSYQAELTLALDPKVRIPSDSSAAITSSGLLGDNYIAMVPGGSTVPLKNGDVIVDTQGAMDLMGLVGQFINKSGGEGSGKPASTMGDSAAAPAAAKP